MGGPFTPYQKVENETLDPVAYIYIYIICAKQIVKELNLICQ